MTNRIDAILEKVFGGAQYSAEEKELVLKTIKATIKEVNDINDEFVGRRIGDPDLEIIYKDEFKSPKMKPKI